jgi:hypothetical protein
VLEPMRIRPRRRAIARGAMGGFRRVHLVRPCRKFAVRYPGGLPADLHPCHLQEPCLGSYRGGAVQLLWVYREGSRMEVVVYDTTTTMS